MIKVIFFELYRQVTHSTALLKKNKYFYSIKESCDMMSMKSKYALKTLVGLAKLPRWEVIQTAKLAKEEAIPKKFLEQILLELKHNGYVASRQGNAGGYFLLKEATSISVAEIIQIFDGSIALVSCASEKSYRPCEDCPDVENCVYRSFFKDLRDQTYQLMRQQSIQDFI